MTQQAKVVNMTPQEALEKKFPNPGELVDQEVRRMEENNFFINHTEDQIREKYIKFTVLMDYINQTLELGTASTVEEFAMRVNNLISASRTIR